MSIYFFFKFKHRKTGYCLDSGGKYARIGFSGCHKEGLTQAWMFTPDGRIRSEGCIHPPLSLNPTGLLNLQA